jgi:hypothetical protein
VLAIWSSKPEFLLSPVMKGVFGPFLQSWGGYAEQLKADIQAT